MSIIALYLHLDGIPGTVTATPFTNHIAIAAFSVGLSDTVQRSGAGVAGVGRLNFSDLSFNKPIDISSISLFDHCCRGNIINNGSLSVASVPPNGPNQLLYRLDLTGIIVTTFSQSATSGTADAGGESFSLNFTTIKATWNIPPSPANPSVTSPSSGWNILANTSL